MARSRRPSAQTTAVLLALAEAPTEWRYGYELCRRLDIKPGSLYPILVRLADRGLLAAKWEATERSGRPPRHLYRLTGAGRTVALDLANSARTQAAARRRSEPRWLGA